MRKGAAALMTAALLSVAGCSPDDAAQPADPAAPTPTSAIAATGAVDQFYERLALLSAEIAFSTEDRLQASVAACMGDLGFENAPVPSLEGRAREGVPASTLDWATVEFAGQWGYGVITDPFGLYATGALVRNLTSDYVGTLSTSAQQEYASALYGPHASQEGITLEDAAWSDCMADAGHVGLENVDATRASVQDAVDRLWSAEWEALPAETTTGLDIDEVAVLVSAKVQPQLVDTEITTAVAVDTCRESVGYTEAAQVVSDEHQAELHAEHQDEFDAIWRDAVDRSERLDD